MVEVRLYALFAVACVISFLIGCEVTAIIFRSKVRKVVKYFKGKSGFDGGERQSYQEFKDKTKE